MDIHKNARRTRRRAPIVGMSIFHHAVQATSLFQRKVIFSHYHSDPENNELRTWFANLAVTGLAAGILISINMPLIPVDKYGREEMQTREDDMGADKLTSVIEAVKKAHKLDAGLFAQAVQALKTAFPDETFADAEYLIESDPTEAVLHLVSEHLPDWSISLKGKAENVNGEWSCILRKSGIHDNEISIGIGSGRTLSLAVLCAVLRASLLRIGG